MREYGSVTVAPPGQAPHELCRGVGVVERPGVFRHVQHQSASSTRRRDWLVVAVICTAGVAAIMATSPTATSNASGAAVVGTSKNGGAVRGSLLVERLPASATRPIPSDEYEQSPLHKVPGSSNKRQRTQRTGMQLETSDESETLDYLMTNFYHLRDGKPGALIPWLQGVKLAEPYMDTTLTVTAPREGHSYHWEILNLDIDEQEHQVMATASGTEVTMQFTKLDVNYVHLKEVDDASGTVMRALQEMVMVKYVRREIRTLTSEDREELFDSVSVKYR